jgi:hypothetical protein
VTTARKRSDPTPAGVDPAAKPFLEELARILAAAQARETTAHRAIRDAAARMAQAAQNEDEGCE